MARAISGLLDPVKVDDLVMGHLCPHVHCHVYPQYRDDDPHGPLNPQSGSARLGPAEWSARVEALRAALGGAGA